jgi:hypothetical protein
MQPSLSPYTIQKLIAAGISITKDGRIAKSSLGAALKALAAPAPIVSATDSEDLAAGMKAAKDLQGPMEELGKLATEAAKQLQKIVDGAVELSYTGVVEHAINQALVVIDSDGSKYFVP